MKIVWYICLISRKEWKFLFQVLHRVLLYHPCPSNLSLRRQVEWPYLSAVRPRCLTLRRRSDRYPPRTPPWVLAEDNHQHTHRQVFQNLICKMLIAKAIFKWRQPLHYCDHLNIAVVKHLYIKYSSFLNFVTITQLYKNHEYCESPTPFLFKT